MVTMLNGGQNVNKDFLGNIAKKSQKGKSSRLMLKYGELFIIDDSIYFHM